MEVEVVKKRPGRQKKVNLPAKESSIPVEVYFSIALSREPLDRQMGLYCLTKITVQGDIILSRETVNANAADSKAACLSMLHRKVCDALIDPIQ